MEPRLLSRALECGRALLPLSIRLPAGSKVSNGYQDVTVGTMAGFRIAILAEMGAKSVKGHGAIGSISFGKPLMIPLVLIVKAIG